MTKSHKVKSRVSSTVTLNNDGTIAKKARASVVKLKLSKKLSSASIVTSPSTQSLTFSFEFVSKIYKKLILSRKFHNINQIRSIVAKFLLFGLDFSLLSPQVVANIIISYHFSSFGQHINDVVIVIENNKTLLCQTDCDLSAVYVHSANNFQSGLAINGKLEKMISTINTTTTGYNIIRLIGSKEAKIVLTILKVWTLTPAQRTMISNPDSNITISSPNQFISTFYDPKAHFITAAEEDLFDFCNQILGHKLQPQIQFIQNNAINGITNGIYFGFFAETLQKNQFFSHFAQIERILHENGFSHYNISLQTFANNVIIVSVDLFQVKLTTQNCSAIQLSYSTLLSTPYTTTLLPAFLDGRLDAMEYTYLTLLSRLLPYSIQANPTDLTLLSSKFAQNNDNIMVGKLALLYNTVRREAMTANRIITAFLDNLALFKQVYSDFAQRQATASAEIGSNGGENVSLLTAVKNTISTLDGTTTQDIFKTALFLNQNILKTNIYRKLSKSSIVIRINGNFFTTINLPALPFAVYFSLGGAFQGFHVRFADVSRGGIRLIQSRDAQVYNKNVGSQFQETFNLAFTQNLKNKDIPEFGAKGTILLNSESQTEGKNSFYRYIDGLIDMMMVTQRQHTLNTDISPVDFDSSIATIQNDACIIDNYGKTEFLYFGPDEGTAGFMQLAALHGKARGYAYWRSLTTGKPPILGGIPHDRYAMTTNSVHRYVVGTLTKLGRDETRITKCQTAGPDGDLGSNNIKISQDSYLAIIDGSGVLYDPNGLDRPELLRLATERKMCNYFDKKLLSPQGFFVNVNDTDITLPDGSTVSSGFTFRNNFHFHPSFSADLFSPNGGRPHTVDGANINQLFHNNDINGTPKFKWVIEGANLFFTQDARILLENCGVVLYKDASTNKGGVTSSSLEVLAALAIHGEQFDVAFQVTDIANPNPAYLEYVTEIQNRIITNANLEFECIWNEYAKGVRKVAHTDPTAMETFEKTGAIKNPPVPRCILTDHVSNKINQLNYRLHDEMNVYEDDVIRINVLREYLPQTLQKLVGFEQLIQDIPASYCKASLTAYLASRFVYKYGIDTTDGQLYEFIDQYRK